MSVSRYDGVPAAALLDHVSPLVVLLYTGTRMWRTAGQKPDLESNPALRWLQRRIKIVKYYDGEKLFTTADGARKATRLAVVILLIGVIDVVLLLSYGLAIVLIVIGAKMLLADVYEIPVSWSLMLTVGVLAMTMLLSIIVRPRRAGCGAYPFAAKKFQRTGNEGS